MTYILLAPDMEWMGFETVSVSVSAFADADGLGPADGGAPLWLTGSHSPVRRWPSSHRSPLTPKE